KTHPLEDEFFCVFLLDKRGMFLLNSCHKIRKKQSYHKSNSCKSKKDECLSNILTKYTGRGAIMEVA
ncbi:TPA: hypothetical protein ACHVCJ_000602, partial [Streptococcus suis]